MDLWHLHIFCKVVELKSFSKAGRAVNITQPTISAHIKDIENAYGCQLIDRLPKGAIPTKAGEILYQYARRIIALNNESKTAIRQFLGKISGDLNVGGSTIPGTYILPKVIGDFKQKYPEINISIAIGDTQRIVNDVVNGMIELGFVGAKSKNASIKYLKLIDDEMRLIIPSNHKWSDRKTITLDMLLTEPFISRETGSGTLTSLHEILSRQNFNFNQLNIVARVGSTEAVKQGIKSHVGVSIFSTLAVSDELRSGSLKSIAIDGINLMRSFYLIQHKHRMLSPLSDIFCLYLKENIHLLNNKTQH